MSSVRRPNRFLERRHARRIAAYIRSDFPRHDQQFAYEHLQQLALRLDAEFRILFEELVDPCDLGPDTKLWLGHGFVSPVSAQQQAADLDHFRQTCPLRLDAALQRVAAVLQLSVAEVLAIPTTGCAWSRSRWTKAYGADLLASFYTFEDALAAYLTCELLEIPRLLFLSELGDGATHFLAKLLPLHVRQAAVVLVPTRALADELVARCGADAQGKLICAQDSDTWQDELVRRLKAELRGRPPAVGRHDLGPDAAFRTRVTAASSPGLTPFVLLGAERTGSNLLNEMLQGHPHVHAAGEIFNTRMIEAGTLDMAIADPAELAELIDLRRRDPAAMHLHLLQRARRGGARAAGFKLLYYHGTVENRIVDHLLGLAELRVVHLVREDRMARWISMARAVRSDAWWAAGDMPRSAGTVPIDLDARETLRMLEANELLEERFRATFVHRPVLEISYEQLAGDLGGTSAKVLEFLGLEPMQLQPRSVKTGHHDPRATVGNWRALSEALADTRWQDAVQPS